MYIAIYSGRGGVGDKKECAKGSGDCSTQ